MGKIILIVTAIIIAVILFVTRQIIKKERQWEKQP